MANQVGRRFIAVIIIIRGEKEGGAKKKRAYYYYFLHYFKNLCGERGNRYGCPASHWKKIDSLGSGLPSVEGLANLGVLAMMVLLAFGSFVGLQLFKSRSHVKKIWPDIRRGKKHALQDLQKIIFGGGEEMQKRFDL